ncbi:hypothetical protein VTK56DRAFT_2 [Thermocarpiscus australiensis]
MAEGTASNAEWRTRLSDTGDAADCLRTFFLPCDQFGRTEYRLQQLGRNEDPLDLSGYNGCNWNCWRYFILFATGYGITSGIAVAKQTRFIRETYGISGTRRKDKIEGIFCQPCSLIRNDLEVRQREEVKRNAALAQAPAPLGENGYRQLHAMSPNDGYRLELPMTSISPTQEDSSRTFSQTAAVLLRPPETAHVASSDGSDDYSRRRSQVLTPISERDSLEDPHLGQGGGVICKPCAGQRKVVPPVDHAPETPAASTANVQSPSLSASRMERSSGDASWGTAPKTTRRPEHDTTADEEAGVPESVCYRGHDISVNEPVQLPPIEHSSQSDSSVVDSKIVSDSQVPLQAHQLLEQSSRARQGNF